MDKRLFHDAGDAAHIDPAEVATALRTVALASGLNLLELGGKSLLPVVQGGMGVGISAGGLAGTVAGLGAVGTISSVDLRRHHPDLMEQTGHLVGPEAKAQSTPRTSWACPAKSPRRDKSPAAAAWSR